MKKTFISYSHDSNEHMLWVLKLAEKLVQAGIEVTLDQWDLRLGSDVTRFMEQGIKQHDRVLVICTEKYVSKADEARGGVGFEKQIISSALVRNLGSTKFLPIVIGNRTELLPIALDGRLYVDFTDPMLFDSKFEELCRELHHSPKIRKPALGQNPYLFKPVDSKGGTSEKLPKYVALHIRKTLFESVVAKILGETSLLNIEFTWSFSDGDESTGYYQICLSEIKKFYSQNLYRKIYFDYDSNDQANEWRDLLFEKIAKEENQLSSLIRIILDSHLKLINF